MKVLNLFHQFSLEWAHILFGVYKRSMYIHSVLHDAGISTLPFLHRAVVHVNKHLNWQY